MEAKTVIINKVIMEMEGICPIFAPFYIIYKVRSAAKR